MRGMRPIRAASRRVTLCIGRGERKGREKGGRKGAKRRGGEASAPGRPPNRAKPSQEYARILWSCEEGAGRRGTLDRCHLERKKSRRVGVEGVLRFFSKSRRAGSQDAAMRQRFRRPRPPRENTRKHPRLLPRISCSVVRGGSVDSTCKQICSRKMNALSLGGARRSALGW